MLNIQFSKLVNIIIGYVNFGKN